MTDDGFSKWYAEAVADGKLYGQSPRKIAEMAWQAGYEARKSAEVPPEAPWDELTAIFPAGYIRMGKNDVFAGRTDPDYELRPAGNPGQEAYDRHFGAPGPEPAIPGLDGEPEDAVEYDDETF